MAYSIFIGDPELLKNKTEDDQMEELQTTTERHDYENILKSLKKVKYYYWKKCKESKKK